MRLFSQKLQTLPVAVLALSIILLGASGVYMRFSEAGAFSTLFFRMLLAAPFYILLLMRERRKAWDWRTEIKNISLLALAGAFFAADAFFFFIALDYIALAYVLLIAVSTPLIVLPLSMLLYREMPPRLFWPGLLLALLGMYLTIGTTEGITVQQWQGILLSIASLVCFGIYVFILAHVQSGLSIWQKMLVISLSAALVLQIGAMAAGQPILPPNLTAWLVIVALCLNSQVIGQTLMTFSLTKLPVNLSSAIMLTMPLVGSFYGWLFFAEKLSIVQFGGMLVCLIGVYLTKRAYDRIEKAHGHNTKEDVIAPAAVNQ